MKFLLIFFIIIIIAGFAFADDPGESDSLIIESVYAELGDTVVDVRAYVTCDDSVAFYNFPLAWNSINDSSIFPISVTYHNTIAQWDFHEDSLLFDEVLFRMIGWRNGGPEDPALITNNYREHCWTIRFSLDSTVGPQIVSLDTTFDNYSGSLLFGLAGGINELIPVFTPGMICYGMTADNSDEEQIFPSEIALFQNYPNPFNASTTIEFALKDETEAELSIYNILGQRVAVIFEGVKPVGRHSIIWAAGDAPSGIYFARLETAHMSKNIKIVLLK